MLKRSFLNGTSLSASQVTGRELAYQLRGKTAAQRAVFAVNEFATDWALTNPTDRQLARLFGVSEYQLRQARELNSHERWRVKVGFRRSLSDQVGRLEKDVRRAGTETTWNVLINNLG